MDALGELGDPDDLGDLDNLYNHRFHLIVSPDLGKLDDLNNLSNVVDLGYPVEIRDPGNLLK